MYVYIKSNRVNNFCTYIQGYLCESLKIIFESSTFLMEKCFDIKKFHLNVEITLGISKILDGSSRDKIIMNSKMHVVFHCKNECT